MSSIDGFTFPSWLPDSLRPSFVSLLLSEVESMTDPLYGRDMPRVEGLGDVRLLYPNPVIVRTFSTTAYTIATDGPHVWVATTLLPVLHRHDLLEVEPQSLIGPVTSQNLCPVPLPPFLGQNYEPQWNYRTNKPILKIGKGSGKPKTPRPSPLAKALAALAELVKQNS